MTFYLSQYIFCSNVLFWLLVALFCGKDYSLGGRRADQLLLVSDIQYLICICKRPGISAFLIVATDRGRCVCLILQYRCECTLCFSSYPVSGVDFSINQFVRNLGLEHLIDIFEREQVSDYIYFKIVWARKQWNKQCLVSVM